MRTLQLLVCLVFLPSVLYATILEVPHDFEDLQAAIVATSDGDTILVGRGTYYGGFDFMGKHITIASHYIFSADKADVDSTFLDGGDEQTILTMVDLRSEGAKVIGFTFQNGHGTGDWPNVFGGGIHCVDSFMFVDHCVFRNNYATNRGAGIFIYYSDYSATITNCLFEENVAGHGSAITLKHVSGGHVAIEGCTVRYNQTGDHGGALAFADSQSISVNRVLVHNNGGSGIRIYDTTGFTLDNTTIADNTYVAVGLSDFSSIAINSSILDYNGYGSALGGYHDNVISCIYSLVRNTSDYNFDWIGQGCIDTEPLFVDAELDDYNLTLESACIDAGDPTSPLDPDDTIADMGAFYLDQSLLIPYHLQLTPQIENVPAEGGTLLYDVRTSNNTGESRILEAWLSIELPSGASLVPYDFQYVRIPPGVTNTVFSLEIPPMAPEGSYVVTGMVGDYPVYVIESDLFTFHKEGTEPGFGSWEASGWNQYASDGHRSTSASFKPENPLVVSAYPNPFNPSTSISLSLLETSDLKVTVFNVTGQQVAVLANGKFSAGQHNLTFDASKLASGLYFVRATVPGQLDQTQKVMLVR
jgi:Secretion system C-terminal sorting domain/Right handed beta helix region